MHLRRMTPGDIALGMKLKAQNGWNQLDVDWRRQLDLEPEGGFVAEVNGQGVGTACACVFGDIAWISMVLVDQAQRGQGIGTALMRHMVQYLDERGVATIRLDATPLGRPVYEKLGFTGDFALARYEGVLPSASKLFLPPPAGRGASLCLPSPAGRGASLCLPSPAGRGASLCLPSPARRGAGGEGAGHVRPLSLTDLPSIFSFDEGVTHTHREKLLRHLHESAPELMRKFVSVGRLEGYCLCRPGANAWHIGPLQGTPEAGRLLLLDAGRRFAGKRVYVDVPSDHVAAVDAVQALGLTLQRPFLRMSRGRRIVEDLKLSWCAFGPEKG